MVFGIGQAHAAHKDFSCDIKLLKNKDLKKNSNHGIRNMQILKIFVDLKRHSI